MGRNKVQKNKRTPHYQTEIEEESEKNNRFDAQSAFILDQIISGTKKALEFGKIVFIEIKNLN